MQTMTNNDTVSNKLTVCPRSDLYCPKAVHSLIWHCSHDRTVTSVLKQSWHV